MNFDKAFELVIVAEGGYVNDPKDSGGETILGISRKAHPTWSGWKYIDKYKERGHDSKSITQLAKEPNGEVWPLVKALYRGAYWDACRCDELPDLHRYPLFSCAVNCGAWRAAIFYQRALGMPDDGVIGVNTTKAARRYRDQDGVLREFLDTWTNFYDQVVAKRPDQARFLKGWKNRIKEAERNNE